jgi:hypothetical protein
VDTENENTRFKIREAELTDWTGEERAGILRLLDACGISVLCKGSIQRE